MTRKTLRLQYLIKMCITRRVRFRARAGNCDHGLEKCKWEIQRNSICHKPPPLFITLAKSSSRQPTARKKALAADRLSQMSSFFRGEPVMASDRHLRSCDEWCCIREEWWVAAVTLHDVLSTYMQIVHSAIDSTLYYNKNTTLQTNNYK